jgi:cytochrome c553
MRTIVLFFLLITFSFCSKKEEKATEKKEDFVMYEASEMATLMEQMYVYNAQLKEKIENGETISATPGYFEKINKATFTKGKERDAFFNEHAQLFLETQNAVVKAEDKKATFNTMVDACVQCHEVKCGGPIERIKKLYIR